MDNATIEQMIADIDAAVKAGEKELEPLIRQGIGAYEQALEQFNRLAQTAELVNHIQAVKAYHQKAQEIETRLTLLRKALAEITDNPSAETTKAAEALDSGKADFFVRVAQPEGKTLIGIPPHKKLPNRYNSAFVGISHLQPDTSYPLVMGLAGGVAGLRHEKPSFGRTALDAEAQIIYNLHRVGLLGKVFTLAESDDAFYAEAKQRINDGKPCVFFGSRSEAVLLGYDDGSGRLELQTLYDNGTRCIERLNKVDLAARYRKCIFIEKQSFSSGDYIEALGEWAAHELRPSLPYCDPETFAVYESSVGLTGIRAWRQALNEEDWHKADFTHHLRTAELWLDAKKAGAEFLDAITPSLPKPFHKSLKKLSAHLNQSINMIYKPLVKLFQNPRNGKRAAHDLLSRAESHEFQFIYQLAQCYLRLKNAKGRVCAVIGQPPTKKLNAKALKTACATALQAEGAARLLALNRLRSNADDKETDACSSAALLCGDAVSAEFGIALLAHKEPESRTKAICDIWDKLPEAYERESSSIKQALLFLAVESPRDALQALLIKIVNASAEVGLHRVAVKLLETHFPSATFEAPKLENNDMPTETQASAVVLISTSAPDNAIEDPFEEALARLTSADENERAETCEQIAGMGKAVLPKVMQLLTHNEPALRVSACWIASRIGDTSSLQALMERLSDSDGNVREAAAAAMTAIERRLSEFQNDIPS